MWGSAHYRTTCEVEHVRVGLTSANDDCVRSLGQADFFCWVGENPSSKKKMPSPLLCDVKLAAEIACKSDGSSVWKNETCIAVNGKETTPFFSLNSKDELVSKQGMGSIRPEDVCKFVHQSGGYHPAPPAASAFSHDIAQSESIMRASELRSIKRGILDDNMPRDKRLPWV